MKQSAVAFFLAGLIGCGTAAPPSGRGLAPTAARSPTTLLAQDHAPLPSPAKDDAVARDEMAARAAASPEAMTIDQGDPAIPLGLLRIPPGRATRIRVTWAIPPGTGLNDEAPFRVVWTTARGLARLPAPTREKGTLAKDGFEVEVEPAPGATTAELTGVLEMVVCDVVTHSVCLPVRRTILASFAVEPFATPSPVSIPLPSAVIP